MKIPDNAVATATIHDNAVAWARVYPCIHEDGSRGILTMHADHYKIASYEGVYTRTVMEDGSVAYLWSAE